MTDIQSVSFYSCVWEQNGSGKPFISMSGWPSGLRRQTQGYDPSTRAVAEGFLVHVCGRGFKSHFWHIFFLFSSVYVSFKKKKDIATAGNRTPINCLEGNYANHYTTVAVEFGLSGIQCLDSFKNRPSSHLHTAVFPSTQTNLSLVAIKKLFESDLEKQKEYETHSCLSRQKDKKRDRWAKKFFLSLIFLFLPLGQIKHEKST